MNEPRVEQDIPMGKVIVIGLIVATLSVGLAGGMLLDRYLQLIRLLAG